MSTLAVGVVVSGIAVVVGRCLVPGHHLSPSGAYEAFAHIWCGALLVLGFHRLRWVSWGTLAGASAFELYKAVMFLKDS